MWTEYTSNDICFFSIYQSELLYVQYVNEDWWLVMQAHCISILMMLLVHRLTQIIHPMETKTIVWKTLMTVRNPTATIDFLETEIPLMLTMWCSGDQHACKRLCNGTMWKYFNALFVRKISVSIYQTKLTKNRLLVHSNVSDKHYNQDIFQNNKNKNSIQLIEQHFDRK